MHVHGLLLKLATEVRGGGDDPIMSRFSYSPRELLVRKGETMLCACYGLDGRYVSLFFWRTDEHVVCQC